MIFLKTRKSRKKFLVKNDILVRKWYFLKYENQEKKFLERKRKGKIQLFHPHKVTRG